MGKGAVGLEPEKAVAAGACDSRPGSSELKIFH